MTKGELMNSIRSLSSGTLATIVGSDKYVVIDRAESKALLYVSGLKEMPSGEITMELLNSIIKTANGLN